MHDDDTKLVVNHNITYLQGNMALGLLQHTLTYKMSVDIISIILTLGLCHYAEQYKPDKIFK